jgi:hypothetical protein
MLQPSGNLLSPKLRPRGGAWAEITEHRNRLVEHGAVLLVERGVDQPGFDFGRHFGGRARAVSLFLHHLLDRLDLRQWCLDQPGGAQERDAALSAIRRVDADTRSETNR